MKNNTIIMSLLLMLTMSAMTIKAETAPATDFLMSDGTLNISAIGGRDLTLDLAGWSIAIDPNRGPIFSSAPPATSSWNALDVGLNSLVRAIAVSSTGMVYVGGGFRDIGTGSGTTLNYIAKWDGTAWSALDQGLSGEVRAIAVNGTDVYVGGDFRYLAQGPFVPISTFNFIAKWNGTTWSTLDQGLSSPVYALAISGTDVYVGGYFFDVANVGTGNTSVLGLNKIAKWNGTAWSSLDMGLDNAVRTIAVSGGNVYVGGLFTDVGSGGTAVAGLNYIAKWNGTAWSALDKGLGNTVHAMAVSGTDIYVGGSFTDVGAGGIAVAGLNFIGKWNGAAWSALDMGLNTYVHSIAVNGSDVYAGGEITGVGIGGMAVTGLNRIAKWNGTAWSALVMGLNGFPYAMASSGTDVYVGGSFSNVAGCSAVTGLNNIAKWNTNVPSCTWNGGATDNWSDCTKWSCGHVPFETDNVVINSGTVTLDVTVKIADMTINGGTLTGNNNIELTGALTWGGGIIGGTGTMTVAMAATIAPVFNNPTLDTRSLILNGGGIISGVFNTNNGGNLVVPALKTITITTLSNNTVWGGSGGTFTLAGTLIKYGSTYLAFNNQIFQNTGTVTVNEGQVYLGYSGFNGTHNGATFNINGAGSYSTSNAYFVPNGGTHTFTGCTLTGTGVFGSGGNGNISTFTGNTVANTLGFGTSGMFTLGQDLNIAYWEQYNGGILNGTSNITLSGNLTQFGGTLNNTGDWLVNGNLDWSGGTIGGTGTMTVVGTTTITNAVTLSRPFINPSTGIIKGTGTLTKSGGGTLTNNGIIAPGLSPGTLTINPSVSSTANSIYEMEITGNQADKLESTGNIDLKGTLKLILNNPSMGSYTLFNSTSNTVSDYPNANLSVLYSVNGGAFSATPPPNTTILPNTNGNQIIVNITGSVLLVELLDFKAKLVGDIVELNWQTATEKNIHDFTIERSAEGKIFTPLSIESPKGSNSVYTTFDKKPLEGNNYYRLKINDLDGSVAYSKVVNIHRETKGFSIKAYPNPFDNDLTVEVSTDKKADVQIELIDILGRQIYRSNAVYTEGVLALPIPTKDLPSGTYLLKVSNGQQTIQQKLMK